MYTITITVQTIEDAPFQKTKGWNVNPVYNWSASMQFTTDNLTDAQAKADMLRVQFWRVNNIGSANPVKKYAVSIYEDSVCKYLTEFTGHGSALKMSSH